MVSLLSTDYDKYEYDDDAADGGNESWDGVTSYGGEAREEEGKEAPSKASG